MSNVEKIEYAVDEKRLRELEANDGGGWVPADNDHYVQLAKDGYVVTDGDADDEGDVYYRLTAFGRNWLSAGRTILPPFAIEKTVPAKKIRLITPRQVADSAQEYPVSPNISMEDEDWNRPWRKTKRENGMDRGSGLRAAIKFYELPIGGSRHIAVTEKVPKPWETYASTVAVENRKHATPMLDKKGKPVTKMRKVRGSDEKRPCPVFNYTKRFVIYRAWTIDPLGPGARILRVDPNREDE